MLYGMFKWKNDESYGCCWVNVKTLPNIFRLYIYMTSLIPNQTVTRQNFWLSSSVFKPCHKHVPLSPYLEACTEDNCYGGNNTCSSLEAYATECAQAGICIDWRNATGGRCGKMLLIIFIYR